MLECIMHYVFSNSDSCLYWCLVYVREGISDLHIYVVVTSPYPQDRGVTYEPWKLISTSLPSYISWIRENPLSDFVLCFASMSTSSLSVRDRDTTSSWSMILGHGRVGGSTGLYEYNHQLQFWQSQGTSNSFRAWSLVFSEVGYGTSKIRSIFHEIGTSPWSLVEARSDQKLRPQCHSIHGRSLPG